MSSMLSPRQGRWLTFIFAILIVGSLLGLGQQQQQRTFANRGIPDEFSGPMPGAGLRLGYNVTLPEDPAELDSMLTEIKATGVEVIKASFYYSDAFDWELVTEQMAAITSQGLSLVPLLDGQPAADFGPPADLQLFAAWAGNFAKRYGESIDYYIIWDEPNLTTHWGNRPVNPDEYAALLASSSAAIRSHDSNGRIIVAPLAPTVESGPQNLAPQLYLQRLYEADAADAFDIVAAKPYGFGQSPWDRTVDSDLLNFSHVILLRETMLANNDGAKVIWTGNWGWNSLPSDWAGSPSIWGAVSAETQVEWSLAALNRARQEWPWMGTMFLEHWQPDVDQTNDPRWGFRVAGTPLATKLTAWQLAQPAYAFPGFHLAASAAPGQQYEGGWRFATDTGADISESGDKVTFTFYGTEIAIRIRRADFRGRFHVEVDGQPAAALPRDETGASLILTAPDPGEDYVTTIAVAEKLEPGIHTVTLVADRGWEQWALRGFAVGYQPNQPISGLSWILALLLLGSILGLVVALPAGLWPTFLQEQSGWLRRLSSGGQLLLTSLVGAITALTGWLTWGQQAAGLYRRLGDVGQLTLTATVATIFYIAPSFYIYAAALIILFVLLYLRPAWGLALVAFTLPLYVLPKPMLGYRFSPVEIFVLLTVAATFCHTLTATNSNRWPRFKRVDAAVLLFFLVASLSLAFTERIDVATNEWRVVILEPVLFYGAFRLIRPGKKERQLILDSFIASGLMVAIIGLGQYLTGQNLITAEGGLLRLRSIYGSPNNVALLFDRILPFTLAFFLLGKGWRRWAYGLAGLILALAGILTFSKGGLLLGFPVAIGVVLICWLYSRQWRIWPWLLVGIIGLPLTFLALQQIPALAGRLDIVGVTSDFRINLWRSSVAMIRENPWWGVGLDNFLYAYRGRYILQAAWQEPNLNHPHNILLDYWTRLGVIGLLSGIWLWLQLVAAAWRSWIKNNNSPFHVGILAACAAMLAHGLVDHSFFLVDLAITFFLLLGLSLSASATEGTASEKRKTDSESFKIKTVP